VVRYFGPSAGSTKWTYPFVTEDSALAVVCDGLLAGKAPAATVLTFAADPAGVALAPFMASALSSAICSELSPVISREPRRKNR